MATSNDIAIKVDHVNKTFKLPHEKQTSVKGLVVNFYRRNKKFESQHVLDDVSFEIKRGEFFGIVGRNGSGKSTMLKLLAGIYTPDSGDIKVNGLLTPFIELGVGFNPELTGRENVFLNGALLGFNRAEMEAMYQDIVDFAELERFMDQKLKNYSSGMQVRLAFSIAIRAKSDILLIDEVLAVGDANFQKKCFKVFDQIKAEGRTVVFITHDMGAVERYCDRALLLHNGKVLGISDSKNIAYQYSVLNAIDNDSQTNQGQNKVAQYIPGKVDIVEAWFENDKTRTTKYKAKQPIIFKVKFTAREDMRDLVGGILIRDQNAVPLYAINTAVKGLEIPELKKGKSAVVSFELENIFSDGNYFVNPSVSSKDGGIIYDAHDAGFMFTVKGWEYPAYFMQPANKLDIQLDV